MPIPILPDSPAWRRLLREKWTCTAPGCTPKRPCLDCEDAGLTEDERDAMRAVLWAECPRRV